jgi:hypothetical protein
MNIRIVRNFALMGAMSGALFLFTSKTAHARTSCYECSIQEGQCYQEACGDQNPCPPQPDCQDAYEACLATCN